MTFRSVAIVGAGISGACVASELAKSQNIPKDSGAGVTGAGRLSIHVFDQGRRGPGGRASHRSVRPQDGSLAFSEEERKAEKIESDLLEFDHGCQFFRADSSLMQQQMLPEWLEKGWVAPWKARLGCLGTDGLPVSGISSYKICDPIDDFFGIPSTLSNGQTQVYIGIDGMNQLPRKMLDDQQEAITLHAGTRVSGVRWNEKEQKWELLGMKGAAAYHDTTVNDEPFILVKVDAVVFTDISSASDSWHRASAGIPQSLRQKLPTKFRLPLFACMVAFPSSSVSQQVALDGFTLAGDKANEKSILWFCSRSQSKPGFDDFEKEEGGSSRSLECWTLVSTPAYAVAKIQETKMRDPVSGSFRPQQDDYLRSVPAKELWEEFQSEVLALYSANTIDADNNDGATEVPAPPKPVYLQAQRWGSGLPVSPHMVKEVVEIVGDQFAASLRMPLVTEGGEDGQSNANQEKNFVADDDMQLYYAGDFCSQWMNPGFEAAAISGVEIARHILQQVDS